MACGGKIVQESSGLIEDKRVNNLAVDFIFLGVILSFRLSTGGNYGKT
jgi:hypothetical protein